MARAWASSCAHVVHAAPRAVMPARLGSVYCGGRTPAGGVTTPPSSGLVSVTSTVASVGCGRAAPGLDRLGRPVLSGSGDVGVGRVAIPTSTPVTPAPNDTVW